MPLSLAKRRGESGDLQPVITTGKDISDLARSFASSPSLIRIGHSGAAVTADGGVVCLPEGRARTTLTVKMVPVREEKRRGDSKWHSLSLLTT